MFLGILAFYDITPDYKVIVYIFTINYLHCQLTNYEIPCCLFVGGAKREKENRRKKDKEI